MKVLIVLSFTLIAVCSSVKLVTEDEIEILIKKFILGTLSDDERISFNDLAELVQQPRLDGARASSRNTIDCLLCRSVFAALFDSVALGQSDAQITGTITTLCVALNIASYGVCRGAVGLNMPILTYIIKNTPEATPNTFCALLLQNANNPNVCPLTDTRFEWEIELPEFTGAEQIAADTTPLKIAVITDAHIDPLYEANGVADCDEPTCCRRGQRRRGSYTYHTYIDDDLVLSSVSEKDGKMLVDLDVAKEVRSARMAKKNRHTPRDSSPAGYWGDYRDCDTPVWAFDNVIDEISNNHQDIDLVYYIGDSIDHFVWETTYGLIDDVNQHIIQKMQESFGDVPIIMAIGNHESQPTNQFAPSTVTGPYLNTTWLYESLANKWQPYLTEEALESLRERGDFSVLVRPGLRVISLNNNVAYKTNWWLVYDPQDSRSHLAWLVEQLWAAERAGERVHLLAHIPPGVHDLTHVWTREYNRIVQRSSLVSEACEAWIAHIHKDSRTLSIIQPIVASVRFASTIAAEFNGHTHSDEFKLFHDASGAPLSVAWGAGSATTYSYYNLNYKMLTVDPESYQLTNMQTYVYNLTEANLTPNRPPHWYQLYDFRNSFGLTDLSAQSIGGLIHRMVTTDKTMLDLYNAFYSKLSDPRLDCLGSNDCKLNNLCKVVTTVLWERGMCDSMVETFYSS